MIPADFLAALRARGHRVESRPKDEVSLRLVVSPTEGLMDEDKAALREHKESLLDLLWQEQPELSGPVNFPYAERPAWMFRGLCVPWPKEETCNGEKSEG